MSVVHRHSDDYLYIDISGDVSDDVDSVLIPLFESIDFSQRKIVHFHTHTDSDNFHAALKIIDVVRSNNLKVVTHCHDKVGIFGVLLARGSRTGVLSHTATVGIGVFRVHVGTVDEEDIIHELATIRAARETATALMPSGEWFKHYKYFTAVEAVKAGLFAGISDTLEIRTSVGASAYTA